MQAVSKGVPVKSLGVYLQTNAGVGPVLADKGISAPADLKGKKIAGTAGDALSKTFPVFPAKERHAGLGRVDPEHRRRRQARGRHLRAGRRAAGQRQRPGPTIADKTGKQMTAMKFADYGLTYYSDGLIASNSTLAKTDLVQRM